MFLTVSNLSDCWMSHETHVTIQGTAEVGEVFQYYCEVCPQHQKLTRLNTCSWSTVFVWSWQKTSSFHVMHVSMSQFCGEAVLLLSGWTLLKIALSYSWWLLFKTFLWNNKVLVLNITLGCFCVTPKHALCSPLGHVRSHPNLQSGSLLPFFNCALK